MHQLPLPDFYQRLHADPVRGLSEGEVAQRLDRDGPNTLVKRRRTPEILRFLQHLTKLFALLLWAGAALSFVAEWLMPGQGNLYIGCALVAVVVLNAAFSYYQEYKAEKIMAGFHSMLPATATVMRSAKVMEIPAAQLVRGDVMLLQEGDRVPADARLFEVFGLKVNNASLTGESEPQLRTIHPTDARLLDSRNAVFSGTSVEAGRGKAVVFATGMHTEIGRTAALTQSVVAQETPIRKELRRFSHIIAALAIAMGVAVLAAQFLWLESPFWSKLIFAIGIIVANVPEGLPATVTLCLAIAARHMARRNALVKNLEAVETLGCTTVICTDKTGTLTQNRMRVTRLFLNECVHSEADAELERAELDKLLRVATLCNNAHLRSDNRADNPTDTSGDPTEGALLVFAQRYLDVQAYQAACPRLFEQPFSSKTKHMITINQVGNQPVACLKGAPDVVFDRCDRILINGQPQALTAGHKTAYLDAYAEFGRRAERVLLLAYREVAPPHAPWSEDDVPQQGYIFAGLISLLDPPRPEVPQAVAAIRAAGIRIIMVTGDYQITAEAIGRQVGIITTPAPNVITGEQLRALSDAQLDWELEGREIIFARITPDQKLRIVQALQRHDEIVAMTGDGVNDAPALKQADIGVAMGKSGTDVAREVADMVLMDDNFATLEPAIREGRTIYDNLKKSVSYILTHLMPEITPFLAFILLGLPLPLTIILILSIDLGTDMLPAIALGSERPEADVMQRPPRPRHTHLLNARLLFLSYGVLGMIESAAGFYAYFQVLYAGGWTWGQALAPDSVLYHQAISAFFAAVILCQVANGILSKTSRQSLLQQGLFSNRLLLWGIAFELLLACSIIQIDAVHPFFGTADLSLPQLLLGLPFAVAMLMIDELRRAMVRRDVRWVTRLTAY
jgi:sodium/potassium-transporting ATPase subunit alpha